MNPELVITYDQHEQFLRRVFLQTRAELDGFLQAKSFESPLTCYSDNKKLQEVYEQGFAEGQAKLRQQVREAQP